VKSGRVMMLIIKNLHKQYQSKSGQAHQALRGIHLEIGNKGLIVLLGKSGSGKSTLLNILGGLDQFDDGEIIIKGKSTKDFKANEWDSYRNTFVGFVFQEFYIIDEFTIGKNIALSLELQGTPKDQIEERVDAILRSLDLEGYKNRKPNELSGGQKQRIAIARALVKDPQIILADEPTGNLDSETGKLILDELKKLSQDKLVILVTHDEESARIYGDRIIELKDGLIINDSLKDNQEDLSKNTYNCDGPISTVIKLKKGQPLTQEMIDSINKQLNKEPDLPYIGLTDNQNFIHSLIPEERRTVGNEIEMKVNSVQYEQDSQGFILKDSSLSWFNATKLAFSSLFKRKVRLFFMLLLFTFSLLFVGVATNFSFYNPYVTANLTFKKTNIRTIPIYKYEEVCTEYYDELDCNYETIQFTEEDVQDWNDSYQSINFIRSMNQGSSHYLQFNRNLNISNYEFTHYYSLGVNKLTLINGNESYLSLVQGTPSELKLNEVYITDYHASQLIQFNAYEDVTRFDGLIGKTFTYQYQALSIKGIVDTNYEDYDDLKSMVKDDQSIHAMNFEENQHIYYQQLFMSEETYHHVLLTPRHLDLTLEVNQENRYFSAVVPEIIEANDYLMGNSRLPVEQGEIAITLLSLHNLLDLVDDVETLTDEDINTLLGTTITRDFVIYSEEGKTVLTKSYQIVGVIDNRIQRFDPDFQMMMTQDELNYFNQELSRKSDYEDRQYYELIALLGDDDQENTQFFSDLKETGFRHNTTYSIMLEDLEETTTRPREIFFYIGAVFTVFAAILVYSFISTSIKLKQNQIGILRAIGARGIDVMKIFLMEGFMIAVLVSILTNISLYFAIRFFNNEVVSQFKVPLVLLYMNFWSIFIILIISILVVMGSIYLPLKRITKMKPIQAIKNTVK
jgi:putative ABC transport system permease protein